MARALATIIITFFALAFIWLAALPKESLAFVSCSVTGSSFNAGDPMTINASGFQYPSETYGIVFFGTTGPSAGQFIPGPTFVPNSTSFPLTITVPDLATGMYDVEIHDRIVPTPPSPDVAICRRDVSITGSGTSAPSCSISPTTAKKDDLLTVTGKNLQANTLHVILFNSKAVSIAQRTDASGNFSKEIIIPNDGTFNVELRNQTSYATIGCGSLTAAPPSGPGIPSGENPCKNLECITGIGTIPTTTQAFAAKILSIAIGIAGSLALILMVVGAVKALTSSGDPQKVAGGREMITAAVAGLPFIVFSILILQFIGVQIFGFTFR